MITPIGFVLQIAEFIEYPDRCPALQYSNKIRYRYLRRNQHKQMNVIYLNVEFYNLTFLLLNKEARMQCSVSWAISPINILNLYFGTNTIWYWQCHIVCDNFRKRLIAPPSVALWGQLNVVIAMSRSCGKAYEL